jgi:uncharacterized FAD-dependent dehydrogenase
MAIIISNVETEWFIDENEIIDAALDRCALRWSDSLDSSVFNTEMHHDKDGNLKRISSVYVNLSNPDYEQTMADKYDFITPVMEEIPVTLPHNRKKAKIYVAGFGPAGMFAALLLAECGYNPIVIDRGMDIDSRTAQVNDFLASGFLSEKNNMKFGEGGGRIFQDTKLLSRIGDPFIYYILRRMIQYGAPRTILSEAQPKISSEVMKKVVKGIRYSIIDNGGEVRFGQQLTGIKVEDGKIRAVVINGKTEEKCDRLILAFGQNASDMYRSLLSCGIPMSPRPYFIGLRVEHLRDDVDAAVYGDIIKSQKVKLPPAGYNLHSKIDGRDVFTYRVMGGGVVMPAHSNNDTIAVEGVLRNEVLSDVTTSAICVSVDPSDFGGDGSDPLSGLNFQRQIEELARAATRSNKVPATTVRGFLEGKANITEATRESTYPIGVQPNSFIEIFPPFVITAFKKGLVDFSKKMKAFNNGKAMLTAPESRIIPPVKIDRNPDYSIKDIENIFVCGECAGYSEGVLNAAVEGIKAAQGVALS